MLAQTKHNNLNSGLHTHRFLIGTPLAVTLIFSFAFVLMHPTNTNPAHASNVSQQPAVTTGSSDTSKVKTDLTTTSKLQPATNPPAVPGTSQGSASLSTSTSSTPPQSTADSPSTSSVKPQPPTAKTGQSSPKGGIINYLEKQLGLN